MFELYLEQKGCSHSLSCRIWPLLRVSATCVQKTSSLIRITDELNSKKKKRNKPTIKINSLGFRVPAFPLCFVFSFLLIVQREESVSSSEALTSSNVNAHMVRMTINETEYLSLIDALRVCLQKGVQNMVVNGDLLLIM